MNDFLFKTTSDAFTFVKGQKSFEKNLVAESIDCGPVDGIITTQVVTLSDRQEIIGKTVFDNLEVSDHLEVSNKII